MEKTTSGSDTWLHCQICDLSFKNHQHYSIHLGGILHAERMAGRSPQFPLKKESSEDSSPLFRSSVQTAGFPQSESRPKVSRFSDDGGTGLQSTSLKQDYRRLDVAEPKSSQSAMNPNYSSGRVTAMDVDDDDPLKRFVSTNEVLFKSYRLHRDIQDNRLSKDKQVVAEKPLPGFDRDDSGAKESSSFWEKFQAMMSQESKAKEKPKPKADPSGLYWKRSEGDASSKNVASTSLYAQADINQKYLVGSGSVGREADVYKTAASQNLPVTSKRDEEDTWKHFEDELKKQQLLAFARSAQLEKVKLFTAPPVQKITADQDFYGRVPAKDSDLSQSWSRSTDQSSSNPIKTYPAAVQQSANGPKAKIVMDYGHRLPQEKSEPPANTNKLGLDRINLFATLLEEHKKNVKLYMDMSDRPPDLHENSKKSTVKDSPTSHYRQTLISHEPRPAAQPSVNQRSFYEDMELDNRSSKGQGLLGEYPTELGKSLPSRAPAVAPSSLDSQKNLIIKDSISDYEAERHRVWYDKATRSEKFTSSVPPEYYRQTPDPPAKNYREKEDSHMRGSMPVTHTDASHDIVYFSGMSTKSASKKPSSLLPDPIAEPVSKKPLLSTPAMMQSSTTPKLPKQPIVLLPNPPSDVPKKALLSTPPVQPQPNKWQSASSQWSTSNQPVKPLLPVSSAPNTYPGVGKDSISKYAHSTATSAPVGVTAPARSTASVRSPTRSFDWRSTTATQDRSSSYARGKSSYSVDSRKEDRDKMSWKEGQKKDSRSTEIIHDRAKFSSSGTDASPRRSRFEPVDVKTQQTSASPKTDKKVERLSKKADCQTATKSATIKSSQIVDDPGECSPDLLEAISQFVSEMETTSNTSTKTAHTRFDDSFPGLSEAISQFVAEMEPPIPHKEEVQSAAVCENMNSGGKKRSRFSDHDQSTNIDVSKEADKSSLEELQHKIREVLSSSQSELADKIPSNLIQQVLSGNVPMDVLSKIADLLPAEVLQEAVGYFQKTLEEQSIDANEVTNETAKESTDQAAQATNNASGDNTTTDKRLVDSKEKCARDTRDIADERKDIEDKREDTKYRRKDIEDKREDKEDKTKDTEYKRKDIKDKRNDTEERKDIKDNKDIKDKKGDAESTTMQNLDPDKFKDMSVADLLSIFKELLQQVLGGLFEEDDSCDRSAIDKALLEKLSPDDREFALSMQSKTGIKNISKIVDTVKVFRSLDSDTIQALKNLDQDIINDSLSGNAKAQKMGSKVLQELFDTLPKCSSNGSSTSKNKVTSRRNDSPAGNTKSGSRQQAPRPKVQTLLPTPTPTRQKATPPVTSLLDIPCNRAKVLLPTPKAPLTSSKIVLLPTPRPSSSYDPPPAKRWC